MSWCEEHPGQDCPTCERKAPHKKKPGSPTKQDNWSVRMPPGEKPGFLELIDAASYAQDPMKDDGSTIRERPFYRYWTVWFALVEWCQDHFA